MERIGRFVLNHSKSIIIIVVLLTLVMGFFASKIEIKAGLEDMFPESNPTVQRFHRANELFGGMAFVVIMLEDDDVLDGATLEKIDELTHKLSEINDVQEVVSLTNVKQIKGSIFGIEVSNLIETIPDTPLAEQELKASVAANEQYRSLVSEDQTATCILVSFKKKVTDSMLPVTEVQQLANTYAGPEKIYFTGNPVVVNDAQISMKNDIFKLLPFIIILVVLILWLSFRNISGILLPLSTVLISIVWAIGVLALFQRPLSIISVALPVLLVSVGSAYSIHIVARMQEEQSAVGTSKETVLKTITNVGIAVLIAGTTTMAGFGSLIFSDLLIIREFALSTAFGIGVALVISIFFVPAVYVNCRTRRRMKARRMEEGMLHHLFELVFQFITQKSYWIFGTIVVIVIVSLIAIPGLYPETGYLNYFRNNSSTRIAANLVDQRFGGSATLDIIIHGDINDPDLLSRMAAFQDEMALIDGLNHPVSIVTLLRTVNQALHGDDPSLYVIPATRQQIAQYLLLLNMSDQSTTKNYLTFDEQTARIQFLQENMPAWQIRQILKQVDQLILKHFENYYPVEVTGLPVLMGEISSLIIRSQIESIIASILLTFALTGILLKSIKRGLFCCLTIILTVIVNFGVMGWFHIPLDIATTMIASIAIGIGVDYSIHIYSRYQEERMVDEDAPSALQKTIQHVGRANLYNALAVIAGFCVLLLSSFPPLIRFGGLTALTMIVSFSSAILFLPSLILLSSRVSISRAKLPVKNPKEGLQDN